MELAALYQFKNLSLEIYSKYFDDLLSGERSLSFGLLVSIFAQILDCEYIASMIYLCYRSKLRKLMYAPAYHFFVYNKKLAASKAYSIPPQGADQNPVNLSKIFFFSINLLHAHLQYVCNIPTMH